MNLLRFECAVALPFIQSRKSACRWSSCSATKFDYHSDEYQFLHKSEIPSYHFQKSLRRLPIPKLDASCKRYLNAVKAVYGDISPEFRQTEKVVGDFLIGNGPALQAELLAQNKRNSHTSYIAEPWFDIYLKSRLPCPVNFNPFLMYAPDEDARYNNQLIRATNFVLSFGRFKKALDAECLAPEVFHLNPKKSDTKMFRRVCRTLPSNLSWFGAVAFKAFPLDMSQYPSLFGGSRIPLKGKDRLHLKRDSRHFLVIRNGVFYTVNLFDGNGALLPPAVVHACLAEILNERKLGEDSSTNTQVTAAGLGALTTLERDEWADARNELMTVDGGYNAEPLRCIDDALFVLCLDEKNSESSIELKGGADHTTLINSLLCGGDGSNRWFDKCFQLIVDGHGLSTINFEHSWGDGVAVLRLMEESLRDIKQNRFVSVDDTINASNIGDNLKKLEWRINETVRGRVEDAKRKHLAQTEMLDSGTIEYNAMTRDKIKKYGLSPDSVMQFAIQMAFHSIYKEFVPTYESCSTAAFLKGRTECVRSATVATRAAVLAFEEGKTSQLHDRLRECSALHGQLVKDASMGQGFDRHLLGLKLTAERLQRPLPTLFTDETFQKMGHFVLSTSTLSTDTIVFGGFGPVVEDGLGVGYNVGSTRLGSIVITKKGKRDAKQFCNALGSSLDTVHRILQQSTGF